MKIKVGSRESRLAVVQSKLVMEELKKQYPEAEIELITMKTTGDIILNQSLDKIGGKGLFVRELDIALLEGRIDLAVHSLKDMPMEESDKLPILAYFRREDPRDVLILPKGATCWDRDKPVGCSSFRRRIQLQASYPEVQVLGIRGNVLTRLEKLDAGEYGALVLAAAGIKRLGLQERIYHYFTPAEMLPSAGQGTLAVQGRPDMWEYTRCLDGQKLRFIAEAEREFVRALDGGCSSPVAAFGQIGDGIMKLQGLYYDEICQKYTVGERQIPLERLEIKAARQAGRGLADELRSGGQQ